VHSSHFVYVIAQMTGLASAAEKAGGAQFPFLIHPPVEWVHDMPTKANMAANSRQLAS